MMNYCRCAGKVFHAEKVLGGGQKERVYHKKCAHCATCEKPLNSMILCNGKAWLPDGYSQIFRPYVFGPLVIWTMAPLCYAAKFDPFLSLDCAA